MAHRGGYRPRTPLVAAVSCEGRWGRRRARVSQCYCTGKAEVLYDAVLDAVPSYRLGQRGLATASTMNGHRWIVPFEVRPNAIWCPGRVFFLCPHCNALCTRLYAPLGHLSTRCRRCWGHLATKAKCGTTRATCGAGCRTTSARTSGARSGKNWRPSGRRVAESATVDGRPVWEGYRGARIFGVPFCATAGRLHVCAGVFKKFQRDAQMVQRLRVEKSNRRRLCGGKRESSSPLSGFDFPVSDANREAKGRGNFQDSRDSLPLRV
jgi:hypothetical protein